MRVVPTTFRSRLAALFAFLAMLVGVPAYVYITQVHARQLMDDHGQALKNLAESVATVIAENLNERRREIDLLAQTPLYQRESFNSPDFRVSVERLQKSYPHYDWIGLADANGIVRAATSNLLVNANVTQRPWFIHGRESQFIGDVHEALLLSKLLPQEPAERPRRFIDFAAPVIDGDGRLRGVLAAHANWRWAVDVVGAITPRDAARSGVEIFIINNHNDVIYPERTPHDHVVPRGLVADGNAASKFDNWGGPDAYLSAVAVVRDLLPTQPLGWKIVVRQPREQILSDVRKLQHVIVLASLLAVVVFLGLAWWGASRVSRPIEKLALLAKRVAQGDEKVVFNVRAPSAELKNLALALHEMASTLLSSKHALEESNRVLESKVARRTEELTRLNQELEQLARRDALTGLPNRFASSEKLSEEFARLKRGQPPYAVLMMDIDFFKRVNDTHGHAAGDAVLRHVAEIIRSSLRKTDFAGRVGGEEFLVLLPATGRDSALQVAEKIRIAIESSPVEPVGQITASVGVQIADPLDADAEVAVRLADACLYQAKQAGRNRVCMQALES